jgi:hypothetical protein
MVMGSLFPSFTNFVANLSFVKEEWVCPERKVPLLARKLLGNGLQVPSKLTLDKIDLYLFCGLLIIMMYK